MEEKKYEILYDTEKLAPYRRDKLKIYRIRALKDFKSNAFQISKGDLGGWVSSEHNLSQEGTCWIKDEAIVMDDAKVVDDALVKDEARIYDNAVISGKANVRGWATVRNSATVTENTYVTDLADVYNDAVVKGKCLVMGNCHIRHDAVLDGKAAIWGSTTVGGSTKLNSQTEAIELDAMVDIWCDCEITKNSDIVIFDDREFLREYLVYIKPIQRWNLKWKLLTSEELIAKGYNEFGERCGKIYKKYVELANM